jgi:hypothetical protein
MKEAPAGAAGGKNNSFVSFTGIASLTRFPPRLIYIYIYDHLVDPNKKTRQTRQAIQMSLLRQ